MKLLILDGNSVINRAYFGVKELDSAFHDAVYKLIYTDASDF